MLRSKRSSVLSLFALASILTFAATASAQTAQPRAVALADGVLVDAERLVAYVMNPRLGLDAVDLRSGTLLWSADKAAKPLAAVGDLLIAQAATQAAGRLDVVSFDLRDGSPGALTARVELPSDVTARLQDEPNRTFRLAAAIERDKLVLTWTATKAETDELQGYMPAAEEDLAPKALRLLEGAASIDLASGLVRPAAVAKAAGPRPLDVLNESLAGAKGRLFTSADGRHVLASARQDGGDPWQRYQWTIYERATGARLGELAHVNSTAPFLVADASLFFLSQPYSRRRGEDFVEVPMQIRAVDLASGVELWTKDVSDPSFRGLFPP
ncbi:MAG TPA: hypothetical protein VGG06_11355 [Thermoanaerobaculia bacterium]|jgi:hypothetical protein